MYSKRYFVYIITNRRHGVLYIGFTDHLGERILEHINKVYPNSFSARYNLNKLMYYEEHPTSYSAFVRERQMKKWKRQYKVELIEKENPDWKDLAPYILKE